MKIETAGRLVRCMIYRAALPSDAEGVRKEKVKCSSAARRAMNLRLSWQKLEVVLAENFELTDLVVIFFSYVQKHYENSQTFLLIL